MRMRLLIPFFVLLICAACNNDINTISLEGTWEFQTDSLDKGIREGWYSKSLDDIINLPGSMLTNGKGNDPVLHTAWTGSIYDSSWFFRADMEKYRQPGNLKFPFWLTPDKHYVGAAWYRKEIGIPAGWAGKRIVLFLERVHTESRLWVNDREVGMNNSLVAPHIFDITPYVSPGKQVLTLMIDNRIREINVGPDSHSITDHTQGNWNGVIGRMELQAGPEVWIEDVQVYPDLEKKSATVRVQVMNNTGKAVSGKIQLSAKSYNSGRTHRVKKSVDLFRVDSSGAFISITCPMGDNFLTWDEFDPALYRLTISLDGGKQCRDQKVVSFGMHEFTIQGTRFAMNGRPVFLRGNVDCAGFPLTGYPPMDVESWKALFLKMKEYGLNHVRYHSWCPPEAAFQAADETGFYLQPEGPSWANHGVSLGDGLPIDQYIYDETNRMEKFYGNHPSFVMMAYGNEPAGRHQVEYLTRFIQYWQEKDPRRVYTSASVGRSWPWVEAVEFIVKSNPRNIPWEERPQTLFDFRHRIAGQVKPWVSHEVGQYCAFPNFREIEKYTGVYKAKNFELFREELEAHDMGDQAGDFLRASGRLQVLSYKHELEAALRTPGFAGFQMLQLNDFSGQGTALVGVLDAFFEEKGYTTAEEFRKFCNTTVPLARIPKFVYSTNEVFKASLEMFHFGKQPLENAEISWKILDMNEEQLAGQVIGVKSIPLDNAFMVGEIDFPLEGLQAPGKFSLVAEVVGTGFMNDWDFWVYPEAVEIPDTQDILVCTDLDDEAFSRLQQGGKVLFLAAGKVERGKEVIMHFKPVFWNTSWFQMRPPHTTGILCDSQHPLFSDFPTGDHSDMQWWELLQLQQVMILEDFPKGFRPIIQPIDTWFLNRRLAVLFEAKVDQGKLIVCSLDISSDHQNRPAARQLYSSVINYMNSDKFNPRVAVDPGTVLDIFTAKDREQYNPFTRSTTQELVPVVRK